MRLEKQREQELARRKGLTTRTIIQTIWLFLTGIASFFIVQYLFDEGILAYTFFYSQMRVPGWVPQWAILGAVVLLTVMIMQFFLILGYTLASPQGREKTGKASAFTRNPDPLDNEYRR